MTGMTFTRGRLAAAAVGLIVAGGLGGYGLARLWPAAAPKAVVAAEAGRKILYWYDPMSPTSHFDRPGRSPFMDMPLISRYADEDAAGGASGVAIDPGRVQNLGVRLASVERGDLSESLDVTGVLDFNQRQLAVIQARSAGFVQKVYGRAPGDVIGAGAPLADLLVPAWSGAQTEYLAVRRTGDPALEAAARQRLRLLGMSDSLIADVAREGRPRAVVTVTSPQAGAIQTLDVRQGMSVAMGQTLAQVAGLGTVWLNAAVPESVSGQVKAGQRARAEFAAWPGETFDGRVAAILPSAQADSRTLTVRIELGNRGGRLRPGQFATVHLAGDRRPALLVPSEAVIRTGRRTLVMVAAAAGRFEPVEVSLGREDRGKTEVLAGLTEGQRVVASGQFLIDSEASLMGLRPKPLEPPAPVPASPPAVTLYESRGRIEAVSGGDITLSHEPVPALGWPAMTMPYRLASPALARGLKPGDEVTFAFAQTPGGPVIRRLAPASSR